MSRSEGHDIRTKNKETESELLQAPGGWWARGVGRSVWRSWTDKETGTL